MRHRYPPGPIHLTKTHLPTLPIYYSVGNFKVDYMESLKAKGLDIYAAYGNTTTDIRAYSAFGIPKVCARQPALDRLPCLSLTVNVVLCIHAATDLHPSKQHEISTADAGAHASALRPGLP